MKRATIVYCLRDGEILLGMKKERFGKGKWNGFGGKVEDGEEVPDAAVRELVEETDLSADPKDLTQAAIIRFFFGQKPIFECHVFLLTKFSGEPIETEEMSPRWFPLDSIPYRDMWSSDLYWLPAVLHGETLDGTCRFDEKGNVVEYVELHRSRF